MTVNTLRQKYFDFFKKRGHAVIASASLLPENDASLLFTNSGMSPLVPYFLGEKHPAGQRLVNSQKCFRAEDIDDIGDSRHNTFFEMLGNWSLGDYFKEEQLAWWLEFLFDDLKIDPARIYQTVYVGSADGQINKDEESIKILQKLFTRYGQLAEEGPATTGPGELGPGEPLDFSRQRIFAYRDKNWWQRGEAIGELGGPDSETFYDTGRPHDPQFGPHCHLNCDCGRFLEIGNSVFMQYQKTANGWQELSSKNVDFGGGLERILMVLVGQTSIFSTELFAAALTKIEQLSGQKYPDNQRAFEVIADHIKAATFIIGDDRGVVPANTDQGYIVRRLLRRAIRYGRQLNIQADSWTSLVAQIFIDNYASAYPELKKNQAFILDNFNKEEVKFKHTLEKGLQEFNKVADTNLDGVIAFNLYQSYGFPLEMTEELAREKGLTVDRSGFAQELKKHQELSRTAAAGKFKGGLADSSEQTTKLHTAAHLLLAALRQVLGDQVVQKGSNITAERLRFDFSYPQKLSPEEIKQVEDLVNGAISQSFSVAYQEMSVAEAKAVGASGVFDDRYGEKVKVYVVGNDNGQAPATWTEFFSKEICGGPHVSSLAGLGRFKITKEESSSAGVRRIKAELQIEA